MKLTKFSLLISLVALIGTLGLVTQTFANDATTTTRDLCGTITDGPADIHSVISLTDVPPEVGVGRDILIRVNVITETEFPDAACNNPLANDPADACFPLPNIVDAFILDTAEVLLGQDRGVADNDMTNPEVYNIRVGRGVPLATNGFEDGRYTVILRYDAVDPVDLQFQGTLHCIQGEIQIDTTAADCNSPVDDTIDDPIGNGIPDTNADVQAFENAFGCDDGDGVGVDLTQSQLTLDDGSPLPDTYLPGTHTLRQTCVDLNGNESPACTANLTIQAPEPKACEKDGLSPGDPASDRFCVQSEVKQATCGGSAADAGGILDFLTLDPNEESEKLFFDILTTGDDGVRQAIKISCSRWVDANDPTFNVLIDGAAHISKDINALYGGDLQRCLVDAKRLAEVLNGETVRAHIQLRTDLTLLGENFVGSTISDINIRFQECAVAGSDLDSGSGLPGFDEFGP